MLHVVVRTSPLRLLISVSSGHLYLEDIAPNEFNGLATAPTAERPTSADTTTSTVNSSTMETDVTAESVAEDVEASQAGEIEEDKMDCTSPEPTKVQVPPTPRVADNSGT